MTKSHAEKSIVVHVPLAAFYATITDYLAYPKILDDIQSAKIISREGPVVTVAFDLKVLFRHFDYTLRLVETPPDGLSWTLAESRTLAVNNGGWRLEPVSDHATRVWYWNELASKSWLPKAFINALARIALPGMLKKWASYAERTHSS